MQLLAPAHCGQTFRLLLFVFSLGVLLSAFDAWRRLFDRDMTLSRIFLYVCGICASVCVCVLVYWQLQIAVKRTERAVYSLFSRRHKQHPSPLTDSMGGRRRVGQGGREGGRSDRWRNDLNSEGILCLKLENTWSSIRRRFAEA